MHGHWGQQGDRGGVAHDLGEKGGPKEDHHEGVINGPAINPLLDSSGQGIGDVTGVVSAGELVDRIDGEYRAAGTRLSAEFGLG